MQGRRMESWVWGRKVHVLLDSWGKRTSEQKPGVREEARLLSGEMAV